MRINGVLIIAVLSTAVTFSSLTHCANPSAGTATETENASADMNFIKSDIPRNLLPRVTSPQIDSLVKSNTRFAFDLYHHLRSSRNNLFFSPFSISEAIAMVYGGSKNETADQIANTLRFTMPDSTIHAGFDSLVLSLEYLANETGAYTINNANSIWMQESLTVQSSYLDLLSAYYNTGVYTVDFARAYDSCTVAINTWMSENTAGRITDLIPQTSPSGSLTRLVLVNALYFTSMWNDTFSIENTRDSTFTNLDSSTSIIPFMHASGRENGYFETDHYQAVELLLADWRTSMVVVLPKPDYFIQFENEFTADSLTHLFSVVHKLTRMTLTVPKFSFSSETYQLNSILSDLGMVDAFQPQAADFSGIAGQRDLCLARVDHQGFINVSEWGIEAAAATPATLVSTGIHPEETISIDRPFLFFIRDRRTDTVLFMGRITKL
jgi:serpin B